MKYLFCKASKIISVMYFCNRFSGKTPNLFTFCKAYINNMSSLYTDPFNVILNTIRSNSYYKYKYSIEVETALNKQIESEQIAAFTYLSVAVNLLHPSVSYPGVGGYFMKMYDEELSHMKTLINYQIIRGGATLFKFKGVDSTINPSESLVDVFNKALKTEKGVTKQLEDIIKIAEAAEDFQTVDFITSKFLAEQMYAINELSQYITKLNRLCGDSNALYQFDTKLAKVYPYSI